MALAHGNGYQMPILGHRAVSKVAMPYANGNGHTAPYNGHHHDELSSKMVVTLNSGHKMPVVGLGVFCVDGKDIKDLVIQAIKIGYRHFDTAAKYGNEADLGEALQEAMKRGLVKREELFITSKVWNSDHGHILEACQDSLKKLRLDYLDLYLVHYPCPTRHAGIGKPASIIGEDGVLDIDTTVSLETTWHAMEDLVSRGLVRSIGISNYSLLLMRDCLAYAKIKPAVSQFECHPYFQRESIVKFCQKHGVHAIAHTPLGGSAANSDPNGSVSCLNDPILQGLAEKYQKSVAQIALRWNIQRNVLVIPKTLKYHRLQQNLHVFDFEISKEDMDLIKTINRNHRALGPSTSWNCDIYD